VAVFVLCKEIFDEWVVNRGLRGVLLEILLRDVRCMGPAVDKHMIPSLPTIGLSLVRGVPFFAGLTLFVQIHNHPTVSIPAMMYDIARFKGGVCD